MHEKVADKLVKLEHEVAALACEELVPLFEVVFLVLFNILYLKVGLDVLVKCSLSQLLDVYNSMCTHICMRVLFANMSRCLVLVVLDTLGTNWSMAALAIVLALLVLMCKTLEHICRISNECNVLECLLLLRR